MNYNRDTFSLAEDLKSELTTRLETMVERYIAAHKALEMLGECHCDIPSLPYPYSAISAVFGRWLDGVIRSYEVAHRGIGHASISRSNLSSKCGDFDARTQFGINLDYGQDGEMFREAVAELLSKYDFVRLVEEVVRLAEGLEERGLQEAADRLVNDLGLNADYRMDHPPKRVGRFLVFSRRIYNDGVHGYSYHFQQELARLAKAMEVAEKDAGLPGLGDSMNQIARTLSDARSRLPSRTKIGVGSAIEAVVFNEKVDLKVDHETGDGLLAFMACHTTKTLIAL